MAVCLLVGPAAPGGRAEEPGPLDRRGRIADRAGAPDTGDVLLAAARERRYARAGDTAGRPPQDRPDGAARTAVGPAPRADDRTEDDGRTGGHDRAGAAIGAAEGYGAVPAGRPAPVPAVLSGAPDPGDGGGPGADLAVPAVLVAGALAVAGYAYASRRRRTRTRTTPHGGVPVPRAAELDGRAARALVEADDAVRTSQEELEVAVARFGEAAAKPFTEAVAYARGRLAAAFRLRQRLDDAEAGDEVTRRAMLEEITILCADAERRLDEESAAFDELRDMERTAPEALAAAKAAHRDLEGRLTTAGATLTAMRAHYTDAAAAPVATAPAQAGARLAFAAANLARAREALEARAAAGTGSPPSAAPYLRAAEGAVGQAARLIDAVDRRAVELAEAAGRLPGALAEAEADLAEARGALGGTSGGVPRAGLRGRVARLEAAVRDVRRVVEAGRYDPVDALRRTGEAHAALDEVLERADGARRARAFLDQALLTARSSVGAAEDYVATHRGAVACGARTRLAEARRHLAAAGAGTGTDPRAALAQAQRADALARQAQELAEQDVRLRGAPDGEPGDPGGRGGAVLGGILLGGLPGGGSGEAPGGDAGGPASFGGGGTRGRLGGGGRL